eukprot:6186211-Pleurochrysis_carterae.AAC.2
MCDVGGGSQAEGKAFESAAGVPGNGANRLRCPRTEALLTQTIPRHHSDATPAVFVRNSLEVSLVSH